MELGFRHLQVVIAVERHGSISAAATVLGMSQPSLSSQLTRIEHSFGGPLFRRARTGVKATSLGELVIRRATTLMADFESLLEEAQTRARSTRTLVVSANRTPACSTFFTRVIAALPDRDLVPHLSTSTVVIESLMTSRDVDVAMVGVHPRVDKSVPPPFISEIEVVAAERYLVAISANHRLAGQREVSLRDLGQDTWLLPPGQPDGTLADLELAFADAGIQPSTPHGRQRLSDYGPFVAAGLAVGLALPTFTPCEGMILRPLAGMPLVSKRLLRWNNTSVSREEALVCAVVARSCYLDEIARTGCLQPWWGESPSFRPDVVPPIVFAE